MAVTFALKVGGDIFFPRVDLFRVRLAGAGTVMSFQRLRYFLDLIGPSW